MAPTIYPMNRSSLARHTTFSKRKTTKPLYLSKPNNPHFSSNTTTTTTTVMWSNIAFISTDDECSSVGSNTILSSPQPLKDKNKSKNFAMHDVTEEELKLREELAKEIEKELEREIMEGILGLVRRLSDLKAKQITRGLKNLHLDEFLTELYGSNCCTLCKIGGHVSPRHTSQRLPKDVFGENVGEQGYEGSDIESSTTGKWNYSRKELERWLSM